MKDYQTPLKEHSRSSSDLINRKFKDAQLKKPQKVLLESIAKKNLNGAFSSVTDDVSLEISKESSDFSPISETSDANHDSQTPRISVLALNPDLSSSTESVPLSDLTPTSKISTINYEPGGITSVENYGIAKLYSSKFGPVEGLEADIVVNFLKRAQTEVLNSDVPSKKLLDALIQVAIDGFYTLPEEKDRFTDLVTMKGRLMCLCFFFWSFTVSMMLLFSFGSRRSYGGPFPT